MKSTNSIVERTRRAILQAAADVIIESSDGIGFSVQAVAARAGVTHRTVYNHFPTRQALCEGVFAYVDELLLTTGRAPDPALSMASFPALIDALYPALGRWDKYVHASVMLMLASGRPVSDWRARTKAFQRVVARELPAGAPLSAKQVTAVVRLFASSVGWHVLTAQCGLSTDEATAASSWAARTLLDAAAAGPSSNPHRPRPRAPRSRRPRRQEN